MADAQSDKTGMRPEAAKFREMMYSIVQTRTEFRKGMQNVLKYHNTGITFEMLLILSALWDEQGIPQQVLAERTFKDKACMTNLLGNLEKKGYVLRAEDPADRRNKLVYLTEGGKDYMSGIWPLLEKTYHVMGTGIGLERISEMLDRLEKIREELTKLQNL